MVVPRGSPDLRVRSRIVERRLLHWAGLLFRCDFERRMWLWKLRPPGVPTHGKPAGAGPSVFLEDRFDDEGHEALQLAALRLA